MVLHFITLGQALLDGVGNLLPRVTTISGVQQGSGLDGEDDPDSRERMNPDQNSNSVKPSGSSDHPQETHYHFFRKDVA